MKNQKQLSNRRTFLSMAGLGIAALAVAPHLACKRGEKKPAIQGFETAPVNLDIYKDWKSLSDRKIRVGLIGHGYCQFASQFGFQNHPNVEIAAVSDLLPDRCADMAKVVGCSKTYPSLEELIKDDSIEAVFIATDAPSHAKHAIEALKHGKHVASAVPAVYGSLEDAEKLFETVRSSGLNYMMFETSYFHEDLFAMRKIFEAGGLGKLVYSEGEYFHYMPEPLPSYNGWRVALPPQWYPTHSNAYYIGVTAGSFKEVSCIGIPSILPYFTDNKYKNHFGTEIAQFLTSEEGVSRMAVSWDTPGDAGERGRIRGQKGSFYGAYEGLEKTLPKLSRPPLPPGVPQGGHGGSHGYLMDEFVTSILQKRKPAVDVGMALNLTTAGIVAHQSAIKGGELMKIPQFKL
jgi:predicted dehydrogenase